MADPMPMTDSPITTVAPGWAIAALGILGVLAVTAAMLDGALAARAGAKSGGTLGGPVRPFGEAARLMRQRRRTTVEADRLLWRLGGAGLLVGAAVFVGRAVVEAAGGPGLAVVAQVHVHAVEGPRTQSRSIWPGAV